MSQTTKQSSALLYWVFTVNNPTFAPNDLPIHKAEKYVSWQLEQGESGTTHVQGYVEFTTRQRLEALKKWLPTAHFESRRGTAEQARDYTRKEESRKEGPWERGEFVPKTAGQRSDLDTFKAAIFEGLTDRQLLDAYPDQCARYPQFLRMCRKEAAKEKVTKQELAELRPWQEAVKNMIDVEPHDRQILWVYDPAGGTGKTIMSKWLVDHHGAFYTNGGKHTDIVHAYDGERVVIFDYVRESEGYVNYGVMEALKNGIMFSPKYESGMKRFDTPHVVVFANFYPASGKLSEDRLVIIKPQATGFWDILNPPTTQ